MNILKKIIIFLVVIFRLLTYIINQTISSSSVIAYLYIFIIFLLSLPFILKIRFNKFSFLKIFGIILLAFIMFLLFRQDNIFLYSLVALICMEEDKKEVTKVFFYSAIFICLITIVLGYNGILPMNDAYRTIDGNTDIRVSLGFPNANAPFTYLVPIVLAGIYIFDKKLVFSIIALIISTILFSFCKSRTGYYLIILIIALNLFSKNKFISKFGKWHFLCFFVFSILLALMFGNSKYNDINVLLSGRPWHYLNFLKEGPLVWGKGVNGSLILDNLYLKLLANYSVIGFSLYYYIFSKGSKLCNSDTKLLFSSFFLLLYGVFEAVTVVNFVIVIFLMEIFNSFRSNYEKD